jgi:uncharacterized protein YgiM (DUF1202 family)
MRFFSNCLKVFIVISFTALVCPAVETITSPNDINELAEGAFPYVAQVTGNDVYVRCGPGTNYYPCGKVNETDRVVVVATKFGWSHIVPPRGSFSWISKQYVTVDQNNPAVGVVTGDNVRVYAGSEYREPIHSDTVQLHLNKGDKVQLTGVEQADYYKIVPPENAYLWILTDYTRRLGPVEDYPTAVEPQTVTEIEVIPAPATRAPAEVPVESEKLKEYYALKRQIKAERTKPIANQDYTNIKKALLVIAENRDDIKAARYAKFTLKQIERCELALDAEKAVRLQDAQLQQAKEHIEETEAARLAQVPNLGKYTVIGLFKTSSVYDSQQFQRMYYRIVDSSDETICYAVATGPAENISLFKFRGKQVGLVGKISPHWQTGDVLVEFTEIEFVEPTR